MNRSFKRSAGDYVFLLPYLLLFLAFTLLPLGYGLWMSFFRWESLSTGSPQFAGFENYRDAFSDAYFLRALRATCTFTAFCLPSTIIIALITALALAGLRRRATFYRAAVFLPTMVNVIVAGIVWRWFFSTDFGLFNHLLQRLGLPAVGWLTDPALAIPSIVLMTVWWTAGYPTTILLAGVLQIPAEYYEAAQIDGAGPWRRFWHITLPQLKPVLVFVLVMNIIGSLQVFGQTYVMTPHGGPGQSTRTMVQYIYEVSFDNYRLGYGAAMSWLVFVIIGSATVIAFRLLRTHD